jgi:hypothetical protein
MCAIQVVGAAASQILTLVCVVGATWYVHLLGCQTRKLVIAVAWAVQVQALPGALRAWEAGSAGAGVLVLYHTGLEA